MPASWCPSRGADVDGSDIDEILALAGVNEMTIPASLLESLEKRDARDVQRECDVQADAAVCVDPNFVLSEECYQVYWKADTCGQDKLKEGIDAFTVETEKLLEILADKFG